MCAGQAAIAHCLTLEGAFKFVHFILPLVILMFIFINFIALQDNQ